MDDLENKQPEQNDEQNKEEVKDSEYKEFKSQSDPQEKTQPPEVDDHPLRPDKETVVEAARESQAADARAAARQRMAPPPKQSSFLIVMVILAVLVAAGLVVYIFKDDIFGKKEPEKVNIKVARTLKLPEKQDDKKNAETLRKDIAKKSTKVKEKPEVKAEKVISAKKKNAVTEDKVLFNGKNLAGWSCVGDKWIVEKGEIIADNSDTRTVAWHKVFPPCSVTITARGDDDTSYIRFDVFNSLTHLKAHRVKEGRRSQSQKFRVDLYKDGNVKVFRDGEMVDKKKFRAARRNIYICTTGTVYIRSVIMSPLKNAPVD